MQTISRLLLQMVYEDGTICRFPAGGNIELDLIESIVRNIMSRGVAFKTSAHIENDIRESLKKTLYDFKYNSLTVIK